MNLKLYQFLEAEFPNVNELFSKTPSNHYKVYKIPKKNFGFRIIAQPTPAIKAIQRKIVEYLAPRVCLHESAMAYIKNKSIKDNAIEHINSRYLLKVDLENFFNKINPKMLFRALEIQGVILSDQDSRLLEQFLFWNIARKKVWPKLILSVGAPSSPFVSNLVMFSFDEKMTQLCKKRNITYTRYADDLTFSTMEKGVLFSHLVEIRKMLSEEFLGRLVLKESKTVFSSKANNRHVTGIVLTNCSDISIGRDKKRYISALIHKFKYGQLSSEDILHLKGLLSYANNIEINFIQKMTKKYGSDTLKRLIAYSGDVHAQRT